MGTHQVELQDVRSGPPPSRKRLLAPLRYLAIVHPEKTIYDFVVPTIWAAILCGGYWLIDPKPALFGEMGFIKLFRDLLVMAVPFMVGALAAVAMGTTGGQLDRRLVGSPLYLDGESLTLRQFVCYLLGYLCFLGLLSVIATVVATVLRDPILSWLTLRPNLTFVVRVLGTIILFSMVSALTITVLWSLYFLTVIVNRK